MMPPAHRASSVRRSAWSPFRPCRPWAAPLARLLALVGLITACAAAPREAGVAVMASGTDLESGNPLVTVHPLSRQLQRYALFTTLLQLDSMLQPVPYYARRWSWSPDQRAVTMTLEPTLRWHDGTPTTARDVQFTIDAARDSVLGSPRRADVASIVEVRVFDDTTVQLHFDAPRRTLPVILAELPIVPRHRLDTVPRARWRAHAFSTAPLGNGPFRFVSRTAGRQWRFERNAGFPASMGGPPQLEALVVAVVDEAATKFAGLVSGELDLAGVSPSMAQLVARDPTLDLLSPPVLFSTVLAFNTTRPPFDDMRVRQAISAAIDRTRLVHAAVAGFGVPAAHAIPPGLPVSLPAKEHTVAPNPSRTDSLLDAAGWLRNPRSGLRERNGTPLRIAIVTVGSGDMAVEQLVQADLQPRGIAVELQVLELATFLTTVRASDKRFDLALTGIPGDIALGHLDAMFSSAQRGGALDYSGFHAVELDRAIATARQATADEAPAAWHRVDDLLALHQPVVWLYHARGVQGRARRLHHVTMDVRGELVSVSRWSRP